MYGCNKELLLEIEEKPYETSLASSRNYGIEYSSCCSTIGSKVQRRVEQDMSLFTRVLVRSEVIPLALLFQLIVSLNSTQIKRFLVWCCLKIRKLLKALREGDGVEAHRGMTPFLCNLSIFASAYKDGDRFRLHPLHK